MGQNTEGALAAEEAPLRCAEKRKDMNDHILYNPLAGGGSGRARAEKLAQSLPGGTAQLTDLTQLHDYGAFFASVPAGDRIFLTGGDGTLNRFLNDTADIPLPDELWYAPTGTGNDFWTDLGRKPGDAPVNIRRYLDDLPTVTVKGRTYRFLNGIGYGIDGYCCLEGDRQRETSSKPVNYTAIAIKGLLFHYKPTAATVTVDGVTHTYRHVWLAPVMNGRHYGGGMIPTPQQDRLAQPKQLSVMVYHSPRKLQALMVFPSIFKGEHVKKEKVVEVLTGREITVEFDAPKPLQIDGETIPEVRAYRAAVSTREC